MVSIFKINEICEKILLCDKDVKLVAISHRTDTFFMARRGTRVFETKEEIEKSLANAALRWVSRRSIRTLGTPLYAMAKYQKAKRITVPLGKYGIVLCTLDKNSDAESIATKIIKILKKFRD
jgi:hypothetical protein